MNFVSFCLTDLSNVRCIKNQAMVPDPGYCSPIIDVIINEPINKHWL